MFRVFALTFCLVVPLAGSGCAIVEVGMRNPVVGLETVAVAPFFNLSQERTVDGREFALDYYAELQKVPGFEVLPVGVTERAMIENGISLTGPNDAVRLAQILDVDAVVVGAVTDYDPYNPRIGLKVAWYSPRQFLFLPNEDPTVPFFNRSADAPAKQPGRPKFGTARAQSPDDLSEWVSADLPPSEFNPTMLASAASGDARMIEDGIWETVGNSSALASETGRASNSQTLLAQAELPQLQPFLPDGTSLLVPAGDSMFPTLPAPEPAAVPVFQAPLSEAISTVSYAEAVPINKPVPAPAAEPDLSDKFEPAQEIVPAQGVIQNIIEPPVDFQPSPIARPIRSAGPSPIAEPTFSAEPTLPSESPSELTSPTDSALPRGAADDNPFNRHLSAALNSATSQGVGGGESVAGNSGRTLMRIPPRIAAAEPEFPGSAQDAALPPAALLPTVPPADVNSLQPQPTTMGPALQTPGPVMKTPLFPMQRPEMNPAPMPMPSPTVPALVYDEHVVVAPSDFEPTEPLMAYVRLFDATDRRLIARLSDYLELTGQLRSGDLEAYMKRSEFFRKFTAHVMVSEMLQLHGGEARRQLVLKPRKYR